MKVLLFKQTTDADLNIHDIVAYQDEEGQYTLTGEIIDLSLQDDVWIYSIAGAGAFTADELKLIEK